jgi:hypothetical protein
MQHTDAAAGDPALAVGSQPEASAMTRDEIEALFVRRQAAWGRLDAAALAADYSDDSVVETPSAGVPMAGRRANELHLRRLFAAFPDLRYRAETRLIDGDRVAEVGTTTGTDLGGFLQVPPTDKAFRLPIVCLYTLKGRYIVRERRIYDLTGLLVQVGILKVRP